MSSKKVLEDFVFQINATDLSKLFEPDSIREHESLKILNSKFNGLSSLCSSLKTDIKKGCSNSSESIQIRQDHFGRNDPPERESSTLFQMIVECFEDLMLQILVIASIISTVIGIIEEGFAKGWIEGATILIAIVIIVSVSAGNNYVKEQQFQKLSAKREEMSVHVTREGNIFYIDVKELVVGDLLSIQIGDLIPVDGILVEGSEIYMDESSVTGESDLIPKIAVQKVEQGGKQQPFMVSGSKVMDGSGKMLILAVGKNTQLGQLREKLQEESPPTPLQQKLESIAEQIGEVGTIAAGLTMLALLVNLGIDTYRGNRCFMCIDTLKEVIKSFMIAVTIIVVAVPEGLPLAVTIALAYSVNKMKDENNLVKQLASCEIMGGATTICSDKTGTLTQNVMSVYHIYINDKHYNPEHIIPKYIDEKIQKVFNQNACLNSSANPTKNKNAGSQSEGGPKFSQIGNKTECALIELADTFQANYIKERKSANILRILPFSSSRKKMTTLIKLDEQTIRVLVKGASEVILEKCKKVLTAEQIKSIESGKRESIKRDIIQRYADKSLRTLALAYKDIPFTNMYNDLQTDYLEEDLVLVAIAGIKDPLRPEIYAAVQKCKKAGITVRMCTGDNVNTAVSIAKDAGIIEDNAKTSQMNANNNSSSFNSGFEILEGKKFREIVGGIVYDNPDGKTPEEKGASKVANLDMFKAVAKELKVLARSSPEDKYILVTGLIQLGHVVAVTGDGTNDAPALKKADVGFAMGIAGTEVSKDAADIILLDDNFASIITACKYGRNIYDSIRKFIQFQLTVNAVALFMSFLGSVVLKKSPLNSIEMLWVNIIMDTFASLALSTEPPSESLLDRKPYARDDSIVTANMWRNIFGQSIYQIVILSLVLFKAPKWLQIPSSFDMVKYDEKQAVHFTLFFQIFVLMQVFNEFNARKLQRDEINIFKGLFNNGLFWLIIIITFCVQYFLIELGGQYVGVTQLNIYQHLLCAAIGSGSLIVGIFIKLLPNVLFNQIKLLREEEMEVKNMDQSLSSMLRRKSSSRLAINSVTKKSQSKENL
ncbi:hypothetical protein IMG5_152530 [Ichthyophthirius multifiliis]|uniref:Calcium-transporting ATPase n=1 Tax=Ichthyophthirius multifiliis TaxID=5932 RepID=G0QYV8_ICHMU|nr:hypothetical protein IMG5_152530 [Ichthyophthirius multifiliis]EGR29603.1 hypothetical protein IMG5_152530 [Ichthyophthirius multifiliis]|eukprot:XP_004030839.1 hypothetical protein IMG5_152530 [Ichthyophthirius multifiliis]